MTFKRYVLTRAVQAFVTLILAYVIIYAIVRSAPGNPITAFYGMRAGVDFKPETIAALMHQLGLDKPVPIHFLEWLAGIFRGDLGRSYVYNTPVTDLVLNAIMWTTKLEVAALLIALGIAVPLGVYSATKQGTKKDYAVRIFGVFFYSMPWFFNGTMLLFIFVLYLGLFPAGGAYSMTDAGAIFGRGTWLDQLWHLFLPALTLGTSFAGSFSRIVRSSMLETLRQEYILTARSKGLKERTVIYTHAFRNALLPIVTVIGLSIGSLFSGAAVCEAIFSWPGMGRLIVDASTLRDYSTIMGAIVTTSTVVVVTVFLTDILYAWLDPRIRY